MMSPVYSVHLASFDAARAGFRTMDCGAPRTA